MAVSAEKKEEEGAAALKSAASMGLIVSSSVGECQRNLAAPQ
ncbi:hypothetical protein [Blastopirellula marina]|nr:hypothetical protein [Blastopirellula marina]